MIKRFAVTVVAVFLIFSGTILGLAHRSNLELERVVTQQFNDQQLILARKIASDIRVHFSFLETTMISFSRKWAPAGDAGSRGISIPVLLDLIKDWGVLGIGILTPGHAPNVLYMDWGARSLEDLGLSEESFFCPDKNHSDDAVCLGLTMQPANGPFAGRWLLAMSIPTPPFRPGIPSEAVAADPPILVFLLDAQGIARKYAEGVISGKTGYPWVIDHKGYFMYHIEKDFDGQDSLTIRHARNPDISYERINSLVRDRLLKGEEGTDWYISGWHREVIGEMKKLFAFSPILFTDEKNGPGPLWAVGLAVPDTEVYGLIRPIVLHQWKIIGLFFALVMTTFASFLFISLRWSETLRLEVDRKTEHLQRSEGELRLERDRVKESMKQHVRTQEKLVLSERFAAIGAAAAHISHEIRSPLMLIGGFANQVLRSLYEDDQNAEKLRIIATEVKRLEALLAEVRDFTRPPQPRFKTADLNGVISDVLALLQEKLQSKDIRIDLGLSSDLPRFRFDPDQIKQVVLNLARNAVEAMPDGGVLTIKTGTKNRQVQVVVADTGEGIPPDKMKKLFHPFFTTKKKGSGLGLAISSKIVQDHGGEISASSSPGRGALFAFTLPLDREDGAQETHED